MRKVEYELPTNPRIEHCRSCRAQVVWARSKNKKLLPLSVATIKERDGKQYALSHFTDCPDAKIWSKH